MQLVDLRQLVIFLNNDVFECLDLKKTNVIIKEAAHKHRRQHQIPQQNH